MLKAKMPFNRTYLRTSPQKGVGLTRNGDFSELNEEFTDYKKYGLEIPVEGISLDFWEYFDLLIISKDFGQGSREHPEICQN